MEKRKVKGSPTPIRDPPLAGNWRRSKNSRPRGSSRFDTLSLPKEPKGKETLVKKVPETLFSKTLR